MISHFVQKLTDFMGNPADLTVHLLPPAEGTDPEAVLLYLSSITDASKINELFLKPIYSSLLSNQAISDLAGLFIHHEFPVSGSSIDKEISTVARQLYQAKCVFLANSEKKAIAVDVSQWHDRSVTAPEIEHSIIGPRDAFVEELSVNVSMIRRRIRHENLIVESFEVGDKSRTKVNLVYMKGLVNDQVLEQLQQRIQAINIDIVLDTTQLADLIVNKGKSFNPFPLFQVSERPDKVVASIMEGRVLLLVDTTPTGAIFPATVASLYQTTDDYYFPALSGTFIRIVRYIGLLITLFLPGIYVSITSANYDVLRIEFMLAVAASREGVPYPAYIEVLIMMTLLELINEATVRLPKVIGGTATIVGGLIIGASVAQSHLVSNIMIVVTGAVAIGSYTVANYMIGVAWRMCSYALALLSIIWGLNGIAIGSSIMLLFLCHIKSLGVPYLSPLSTLQYRDLFKDMLFRLPVMLNTIRPSIYSQAAKDTKRLSLREGEDTL